MAKDDPFISHAQREDLYRRTHDPYWREKEEITKKEAGEMYARLRGKTKAKGAVTMNMQDWLMLDPKDKSAALQEESVKRPCDASLIELRNYLKNEIEDERNAFMKYNEVAAKMTHFKLPTWATAIHQVASDELNHAGILDIIVDVITEKCGEDPSVWAYGEEHQTMR
jgi:hypothetical protein